MLRPINFTILGYVNILFARTYIGDVPELLTLYNQTHILCNNISDSIKTWRLEC
jgi:hypothetical protein